MLPNGCIPFDREASEADQAAIEHTKRLDSVKALWPRAIHGYVKFVWGPPFH